MRLSKNEPKRQSAGMAHGDSQDRIDAVDLPGPQFWVLMFIILFVLSCIIGNCVRCAIRCFSPENALGPQWEHNLSGERYVRPIGLESWRRGWLGQAGDYLDQRKGSASEGKLDTNAPRLGPVDQFNGAEAYTPGFPPPKLVLVLGRA